MTPTILDYQIEDFRPEHKQRWKEINEAWVTEDFEMEEIDHQHCSHPETSILAEGGHILVATVDGKVVGTAGIYKENDDVYELIKMAVDKDYRGFGIGKKLCIASIDWVKKNTKAKLYYLLSNTNAVAAVALYRKLGFVEVPLENAEWERANIKMEMQLP